MPASLLSWGCPRRREETIAEGSGCGWGNRRGLWAYGGSRVALWQPRLHFVGWAFRRKPQKGREPWGGAGATGRPLAALPLLFGGAVGRAPSIWQGGCHFSSAHCHLPDLALCEPGMASSLFHKLQDQGPRGWGTGHPAPGRTGGGPCA